MAGLNGDELAMVRNRKIGFVFQGFNLLPRLTARANIALPLGYAGLRSEVADRREAAALVAIRRYIDEGSKISRDLTARYAN